METWLGWFDESSDLERHPEIAVLEAWAHGLAGRPSASERWLALAERATLRQPLPDGSASIEPWLAVVRATHCARRPERMQADAELALDELGPASGWRPAALVLRGAAHLLLGEDDLADAAMAEAAEQAESIGVVPSRIVALSRALAAGGRPAGDEDRAAELALEARALVEDHGLEDVRPQRARLRGFGTPGGALRESRPRSPELERARALEPQLTPRAALVLGAGGPRARAGPPVVLRRWPAPGSWLALADSILLRRPRLGVPRRPAGRARGAGRPRRRRPRKAKASTLTPAELRLLPLLATYLSFREIGEHLFVSRNTVKTQAISVYRKLGVSSRSEAIERASELGLVERAA